MKGFLDENKNKDKSSKRLAGFIGLAGVLFISIFAVLRDASVVGVVIWPLVSLVGVLLGVTAIKDLKGDKK